MFQREDKYFRGEKFEIDGTVTNDGANYKTRSAKSVNILISFKFIRFFL